MTSAQGAAASQGVARLERALGAAGWDTATATIAGRQAVVGRRSTFRLRWLATRMHTFVVAAPFGPSPDPSADLDAFLREACGYAIAHKGGLPRGLQTLTAAVAVAVVDEVDDATARWATHPHGRRFAAMAYPVAADARGRQVFHVRRMLIGALYNGYLRGVADDVVGAALRSSP